jgi:hypothetical protein
MICSYGSRENDAREPLSAHETGMMFRHRLDAVALGRWIHRRYARAKKLKVIPNETSSVPTRTARAGARRPMFAPT